jgi:hypothetical protein
MVPVAITGNHAMLKLVSLQGRILKEYEAGPSKAIIETERIFPGVYVLQSVSGKEQMQNKIFIR